MHSPHSLPGVVTPPSFSLENFGKAKVLDQHAHSSEVSLFWREQTALIIFLRHFGCIACEEQCTLLTPRLSELARFNIRTVLIGCGPASAIPEFIQRNQLPTTLVSVYTDPTLATQKLAGMIQSVWGTWGPPAWLGFSRALFQGHRQVGFIGAQNQQSGAILIGKDNRVLYYFHSKALGQHVPLNDVMTQVLSLAVSQSEVIV